ncbi:MAG TPA: sorbosone dehydrogenase family protein [Casimicrobiaceae bacterium]|nr:sorbosone dehydrogenase family protein [Casimicrobiaceae bacterium]
MMASCGGTAELPLSATVGPQPQLIEPQRSLLPTVNIASAHGWPADGHPTAGQGLAVARFADGLAHPRWLYVLPNGDVLVAETDAPPKPDDGKGVKGFVMKQLMKKAGSGKPSANRITLLRDADGDGIPETRNLFIANVTSPFGMALVGNDLYVAATDALLRYRYEPGATSIAEPPAKLVDLPAGSINHHWTKNVIASRDGKKLYVTVGSNSNVAENGLDNETDRAAIWEVDVATGAHRIFASGLRNPNGMAWEPESGALWTSVNERDELGGDLVPDYMTSVVDGGFYGWPFSYYGQHVDSRVKAERPDLVARARVPDYALGAHTASLGLVSSQGTTLPDAFKEGMFVGRHGSWNRKPRSGYDVVFVPFRSGKPSGAPINVLTDFVSRDGDAYGRPVGVAIDGRGALLVADDVGNTIWRVTAAKAQRSASN